MHDNALIAVQNLGYKLPPCKRMQTAARWILRDVSFTLERGALCAVLGPNGVGKSTLLRMLAGMQTPATGDVIRRGRIGYVPQAVHPALPLSALEMTLLGCSGNIGLFGAPRRQDYDAAYAALARVEAAHLAARSFSMLSGGERQLVLMARALAAEADILILDEPTAALDWHNQALIMRLLHDLADEGVTVITSTHAPQHAFEFASHAILLFDADRFAFGTPAEVMDEAALSTLFHLPVYRIPLLEQDGRPGEKMAAIPVFSAAVFSAPEPLSV
ncbi:MAG: ABC transporter ATP-binding protein [Azoarcus sp.]|jgi:iron complex transport system ATP-binding protein|nr:ABC transporter ATP-binding protein [Azoarcus sp.]